MKQIDAIEIMSAGSSVFLTGAPGAGKTYTLDKYIEAARKNKKKVAVTASTGIAASHINGQTIHSWSGIGIKNELTKKDIENIRKNSKVMERWKWSDVLIIDEISMISGHFLNMLNELAKAMRKNDRPFGGLQMIFVGDLFQLPPITRGSLVIDFAHLSAAWHELDPTICYITEQHRQEGEDKLLDVLISMRKGEITDGHKKALASRIVGEADKTVTRLFSHNADVDSINRARLNELPGKIKTFHMESSGDPWRIESMKKSILAPEKLELKVGAEVMFVANHHEQLYVNGTRGKILKFDADGDPVVKTTDGRTIYAEKNTWRLEEYGRTIAKVKQIPLRLAWAITIHKSQGMSLDAAQIDLSRAFTSGMGYVALSRVRSIEGLYLVGMNDMALEMHEEIYEFDKILIENSGIITTPSGQQTLI